MVRKETSAWREIFSLARGRWREVGFVAFLVSLGTMAALVEPWIYSAIIDDIAGLWVADDSQALVGRFAQDVLQTAAHLGESALRIASVPLRANLDLEARTVPQAFATVAAGAVLMVVMRLVSQWFATWGENRAVRLGSDIERDFITRTYRHVLRLPLEFFNRRASGKTAKQVDQADQISPIVTGVAQELWPELFSLVAILVVMVVVDKRLALVTFVSVPVYAFVTWRMTRALDVDMDDYYGAWEDVSARIQEGVAGIKTVRAFGAAEQEAARLGTMLTDAYEVYLRRSRLQNKYAMWQSAVVVSSQAGVLAMGGYQALQHELTPGTVVLFLTYLEQLYSPIESLTHLYTRLRQHLGSLRRARRLLEEPESPGETLPALVAPHGAIEVRDVTFAYDGRTPVLDGVSFRVAAGERVALVGPSGAGKTTLTDLVAGLYRPQRGAILIDGIDLATVAPSSVQRLVRGVAVDSLLFRGSIAENVRYGRFDAGDADVVDAIRMAGLSSFVEGLPEGLGTLVGERGVQLSAGERQRILLARAFLAQPRILLLDEATANLDYRTEANVKQSLSRAARGRTTLLVAHRKSMLTDVDRVVVIRNGKVEQDGTPDALRAVDGYFRQMMEADDTH